jgi:hypothetical protein
MSFSRLFDQTRAWFAGPRLTCARSVWLSGVDELRRRAGGQRESGALLLGSAATVKRRISEFLYYDDLDPHCFDHGIVELDGRKLGRVWERCRASGMTVVADVHVHPGGYSQSRTDRVNPMIAEAGHFAIIIPEFARAGIMPGSIGIYEYVGGKAWVDHSSAGRRVMRIGAWPWWI